MQWMAWRDESPVPTEPAEGTPREPPSSFRRDPNMEPGRQLVGEAVESGPCASRRAGISKMIVVDFRWLDRQDRQRSSEQQGGKSVKLLRMATRSGVACRPQ